MYCNSDDINTCISAICPDRFHVLIALCGVLPIFCSLFLYMYFEYNFIVITSGQSNLTTGRIAATHGRFNGIRQVAPVCTPPNMLPWTHSSLNLKRHLDWFSRFAQLTAGVPILYNGQPLPSSKLPLPIGDLDPYLIHGSLGPAPKSSSQTASRSGQPVLQDSLYCDR